MHNIKTPHNIKTFGFKMKQIFFCANLKWCDGNRPLRVFKSSVNRTLFFISSLIGAMAIAPYGSF